MIDKKATVAVAMSGGVDSSVAAALLIEEGYQVIGLMLRLWNESGKESENKCCTPDSVAKASRVSARLGIPFFVIDGKEFFYETVVKRFINDYQKGLTPNPCMICNQKLKWGFLLDQAKMLGVDYLATGHYARTDRGENGNLQLLKAKDEKKDQSYVLSRLDQTQIEMTLFPLGNYYKDEVRQIAERNHLEVAHQKDSQDLCFLGESDYRKFLERIDPHVLRPGEIRNQNGEYLGIHQGLAGYTIGQRKGINVGAGKPLYVMEKNCDTNTLIVGSEGELGFSGLSARDANWISGEVPETGKEVQVKIRYKAKFASATLEIVNNDTFNLVFDEPLRDITPGQYAVIYDKDVVLGSGIIISSRKKELKR